MDGIWLVLGSPSANVFAASMFTDEVGGGAVRSSLFGDAFSFEHVKFEVLMEYPSLAIR